jgi:hypothetical protein
MKYLFVILFLVSCESKFEQNQRLVKERKVCTDDALDYEFDTDVFNNVYARCTKPKKETNNGR